MVRDDIPIRHERGLVDERFPVEVIHPGGRAQRMEFYHWHEPVEISFVTGGRGRYEIEDKILDVTAGDLIVVNNVERHRAYYEESTPLFVTTIHVDPQILCSYQRDRVDSRYVRLFSYASPVFNNRMNLTASERQEVRELIDGIVTEYQQRPAGFDLMIKSHLLALVTSIMRANAAAEEGGPGPQMESASEEPSTRIERIVDYVRENYGSDLDLGTISSEFGMSQAYFSHFFHRSLGITFSRFVRKLRLQQATRLLDEGDLTADAIAKECGFNSRTSLYRALRQHADR